MPRCFVLLGLLVALDGCVASSCAQPSAWQVGGVSCLASPAASGAADPATGCPGAIDRAGPDFEALDALTFPGGPHRYAYEAITTASERRTRASACCYTLEYPPPPGG